MYSYQVHFFFLAGDPFQFVVTVLSHQQASSSTDKLPYYHLTPGILNNVTVVIGGSSNVVKGPDQAAASKESRPQCLKHRIGDLG